MLLLQDFMQICRVPMLRYLLGKSTIMVVPQTLFGTHKRTLGIMQTSTPGPVTYDMGPLVDDLHFKTDGEAITLADRWWAAIDEALFDGTVGTPPRIVSASVSGVTVTVIYDRDLETAIAYTTNAWSFDDDGSTIAATSATKTGVRTVSLVLASAPASSSMTLVLGGGVTAQGGDVPRGLGGQPALAGNGDGGGWREYVLASPQR